MEQNYSIKQKKFKYLFMMLLLFLTDSAFVLYGLTYGYYASMFISFVIGAYCMLKIITSKLISKKIVIVLGVCFWIVGFGILQDSGIGPTLKYFCILYSACYISLKWNFNEFVYIFVKCLFFLACIALAMWIVVVIFPESLGFFPTIVLRGAAGQENSKYLYHTIFLANMYTDTTYTFIPRLYSIFWEPGVAEAYFNICLLFTVFKFKGKKKFLYSLVFSLAVLATLSTTGYLCFAVVGIIALLKKNTENDKYENVIKILIIILIIVIIFNLSTILKGELYESVFGKMQSGTEHQSFSSRINSVFGNLKVIISHPFFGVGLNKTNDAVKEFGYNISQTNTVMDYFCTFGMLIGLFFVFCWYKFIRLYFSDISKNKFILFLVFLVFLIIMSGEDYIYSIIFTLFMMYGLNADLWRRDFTYEKY